MKRSSWNRDEQIIVLYYYLVKGARGFESDELVKELANLIPRHSAASIAMKIGNYTYLNSAQGGGLEHVSRLDREIWQCFSQNTEELKIIANKFLS